MATLEAVGLRTATYTGDTAMEVDGDKEMNDNEETKFDTGGDDVEYGDDDYDNDDINDSDNGNNSGNSGFSDSFPTYAK